MNWYSPEYCFIVLGVSEIALAMFKRSGLSAKDHDRGSFLMLWGLIGACIYASIHITFALPGFEFPWSPVVTSVAMVLFIFGLGLRWWSIIHLGRFFTVNVAIAHDHRVIDDGPYRHVRHPSYTGALMAFVGLGLMLGNWLAALVLVLPVLALFLWRIRIEERALLGALGGSYADYMSRTKRLIPFIY